MSTLRTNALEGVDAKNSITIVAGAGNVTTTNVQEGLNKVWIDIPEGQASINDSFNVASLTDTGQGDGAVNFTSSFASANYCILSASQDRDSSTSMTDHDITEGQQTTAKYDFETILVNASQSRFNIDGRSYSGILGDLA